MSTKTIKRDHPALRDDIADLVTRRPIPGPSIAMLDPFLFLNHHGPQTYGRNNDGLPFGPHPHRGFETVTFILEGELTHRDSAGHESSIYKGGVQWMTAGSGLIHAEVSSDEFKQRGGPLEILQLWVNLPSRMKMVQPRYIGLQHDAIPALTTPDGKGVVNLISGAWNGNVGPVHSLTGIFMSTLALKAGGRVSFPDLQGRNVFLYVVSGSIQIAGQPAGEHTLVELSDEGNTLDLIAETDAVLLFGHGDPIKERVVAHGPFVMNTRQEIIQAIDDYQSGKFGAALV